MRCSKCGFELDLMEYDLTEDGVGTKVESTHPRAEKEDFYFMDEQPEVEVDGWECPECGHEQML